MLRRSRGRALFSPRWALPWFALPPFADDPRGPRERWRRIGGTAREQREHLAVRGGRLRRPDPADRLGMMTGRDKNRVNCLLGKASGADLGSQVGRGILRRTLGSMGPGLDHRVVDVGRGEKSG